MAKIKVSEETKKAIQEGVFNPLPHITQVWVNKDGEWFLHETHALANHKKNELVILKREGTEEGEQGEGE